MSVGETRTRSVRHDRTAVNTNLNQLADQASQAFLHISIDSSVRQIIPEGGSSSECARPDEFINILVLNLFAPNRL